MTDEELADALAGMHAYDTGSTDSGIHDPALRARVVAELERRIQPYPHRLLGTDPATTRVVRDLYLTDERIEQGYSLEDFAGVLRWFGELTGVDLS